MVTIASLGDGLGGPLAAYLQGVKELQDRIKTVAGRTQVGAYCVGPPGVGKTYWIERTLKEIFPDGGFTQHNNHVTAKGTYNALRQKPEDLHLFDDDPSMFNCKQTLGVLLAALGGKAGVPRPVRWETAGDDDPFQFVGGAVFISNSALGTSDLHRALADRVCLHEFAPTNEQVVAFLRHEAAKGTDRLTPAESKEVCEFVIAETAKSDRRLSLRSYFKGLGDFYYWKSKDRAADWRGLILKDMRSRSVEVPGDKKAATRKMVEEIINELGLKGKKAEEEFERRGGGSRATFHRFKKEVESRA